MSKGVKIAIGIVLAVLLGLGLRSLLYEQVEVPDIDQSAANRLTGKLALDNAAMMDLLEAKYGEVQVVNGVTSEKLRSDGALIIAHEQLYPSLESGSWLEEVLSHGADIIFTDLSHAIYDTDGEVLARRQSLNGEQVTINLDQPYVVEQLPVSNGFSFGGESRMHFLDITDPGTSVVSDDEPIVQQQYDVETVESKRDRMGKMIEEVHPKPFYCKWRYKRGTVAVHSMPIMYKNYYAQHDFYLPHFEATLGDYQPKEVFVVKREASSLAGGDANPLSYIMKYQSVRLAGYLLLVALLIWLWNSRRRERAIPLITPVENTTMDFVTSVARLYASSDSRERLTVKMVENFYRFNEEKYQLSRHLEDYWSRLVRISGVSQPILDQIASYCITVEKRPDKVGDEYRRIHMLFDKYYKTAL